MFFKRKPKEICFHEWKTVDYHSYVDISLAIEECYEIGCTKCKKVRTVDEYEYKQMKDKGFVKV